MERRKTYTRIIKRRHKKGSSLPYVYNNKVYLRKRQQKDLGAISKILANLIPLAGPIIGGIIWRFNKKKGYKLKTKKLKRSKRSKRIKGPGFFGLPFLRNPAKLLSDWRKTYH